jgi:hypothetical protein
MPAGSEADRLIQARARRRVAEPAGREVADALFSEHLDLAAIRRALGQPVPETGWAARRSSTDASPGPRRRSGNPGPATPRPCRKRLPRSTLPSPTGRWRRVARVRLPTRSTGSGPRPSTTAPMLGSRRHGRARAPGVVRCRHPRRAPLPRPQLTPVGGSSSIPDPAILISSRCRSGSSLPRRRPVSRLPRRRRPRSRPPVRRRRRCGSHRRPSAGSVASST